MYDRLIEVFGEDEVFMDVDAIEAGEDFLERIGQEVASCQVFIALIGEDWLRLMRERMSNPDDYVRFEVAAALDRELRVIPVLVKGVSMPAKAELPPQLARLSERNAFTLTDLHWRSEVDLLIAAIQRVLEAEQRKEEGLEQRREEERRAAEKREAEKREATLGEERVRAQGRRPSRNVLLVGGLCVVVVAVVALVAAGPFSGGGGKSSDNGSRSSGPVASGFVAASTPLFTTTVPAGMQQGPEVTKAKGHLKQTTWRDPSDPDMSVRVDAIPNATSKPIDRAARTRATTSAKPGYEEVSFEPTALSGRDGVEWIFRLDGKQHVDYFLNSCKDGFAVIGSTPPARFSDFKPAVRRVAESLRARSCS
jgi:hypothetical protein